MFETVRLSTQQRQNMLNDFFSATKYCMCKWEISRSTVQYKTEVGSTNQSSVYKIKQGCIHGSNVKNQSVARDSENGRYTSPL